MFCPFNGLNTCLYISNISKYSDHRDVLRTNTFQIKDTDISSLFSHIGSSNHIQDFTLNTPNSCKRNLGFSKYFLADGSYPLPQ